MLTKLFDNSIRVLVKASVYLECSGYSRLYYRPIDALAYTVYRTAEVLHIPAP